jgi:cytochrome c oxidase cbb3-type subunit III
MLRLRFQAPDFTSKMARVVYSKGSTMSIRTNTISAIFIAATVPLVTIAGFGIARAQEHPSPEATAAIERGRKQFAGSCGFCHGTDATGGRGPDLLRSPLVAHDVKGDKLSDIIRQGRPDKGMPAQVLSDQQISDISAFLHARIDQGIESSGIPSAYPIEKLLTGNAEAGKAYFNGAGRCNDCHSPTGDLAGVARKYSSIELESRMIFPRGPRPNCTVTLANGEQIAGRVKHLDEFVVIVQDSSGGFRSFSLDQVKLDLQDPLAAHHELLNKITPTEFHNLFAFIASLK